jgi:tripartite-type tricarboxylate transporter receptor subunit TctC
VPFAPDLVTDPDDQQLLQLAFTPLALGRPLLLPPEVPADRVAALRQALMQTFADPDFLANAKKTGLQVNSPRSGEDLLRAIARAYRSPPQIIARLRQLNKP